MDMGIQSKYKRRSVMKKSIKGYENYEIFDDGTVINLNTNKILTGSIGKNGYKYYRLSKNGSEKMFYAHRLVAEAFLENSNNFPVVNHIDGNKLNNNIDNLEWVSYSENTQHFHKNLKNTILKKQEKYKDDLPNEIWVMTLNNPNYLVSSCGRVRHYAKGNLLRPSETCGYYKVRLSYNGKITDWLIHKLVFFSFHSTLYEKDGYVIDHIDGDKHNNNLSNLRLITLSENVKEAYYNQKTNSNIKPINQYDLNNNLIATFPSSREAGRQLKLDSSSIIKCCKGKLKTTGGFIFHYA